MRAKLEIKQLKDQQLESFKKIEIENSSKKKIELDDFENIEDN